MELLHESILLGECSYCVKELCAVGLMVQVILMQFILEVFNGLLGGKVHISTKQTTKVFQVRLIQDWWVSDAKKETNPCQDRLLHVGKDKMIGH